MSDRRSAFDDVYRRLTDRVVPYRPTFRRQDWLLQGLAGWCVRHLYDLAEEVSEVYGVPLPHIFHFAVRSGGETERGWVDRVTEFVVNWVNAAEVADAEGAAEMPADLQPPVHVEAPPASDRFIVRRRRGPDARAARKGRR